MSVTYHETESDANIGKDNLRSPYTNTSDPQTIHARITNNTTGCFTLTRFELDVFSNPSATQPNDLATCDDATNDGIEVFNLTLQNSVILGIQPAIDFKVRYFTDAALTTEISTPTAYTNTTNPQTIHVLVESKVNTACRDIDMVNFDLVVDILPIATPLNDMIVCDDPTNDGIEPFDLTLQNSVILGFQSETDFKVRYFTDVALTTEITAPATFSNTSSPQTIYAQIETNSNTNCVSLNTVSFDVVVFETPLPSTSIPHLEFCDNTTSGTDVDGFIVFNLEDRATDILNGQSATTFDLSYFTDAGFTNQITNPASFTNTIANGQTIHVQMTNTNDSSCVANTTFNVEVFPLPVITTPVELKQCDVDGTLDGLASFNLNEANELISADHINETFTYYLSDAEALSGLVADQITNPTNYTNPSVVGSEVFVRIETVNDCFRTAKIDLITGASQIPTSFQRAFEQCDDGSIETDYTDGVSSFNFSSVNTEIEALFPSGLNVTITYYNSLADATAELNVILDISTHRNAASPNSQDIYVRVDSDDVNACLGLGHHITLTVNPLPIRQNLNDLILCSDSNEATFDLTLQNTAVIGSQSDLIVSYHETIADAAANIAIMPTPTAFTNNSNPQEIIVRATVDANRNGIADSDECFNVDMSFNLIVNSNPTNIVTPDPIQKCNDQVVTLYDLTIREAQIKDGDNSLTLTYFESVADLVSGTAIADPTMYTSTTLTKLIIVQATAANSCTDTVDLELVTTLYANYDTTPTALEECEVDNDGFDTFDLTRSESDILHGLAPVSDFVFSYYEIESDAQAGNSDFISTPSTFINTSINSQTIYVRVIQNGSLCFKVIPLEIIVRPVPEIAIEPRYVICLDKDDASIPSISGTFLPMPPIETQLSATMYTFQWYTGTEALTENLIAGATGASFTPTNEGVYTVIVTNRATQCTIPATTTVISSYPPESVTATLTSDLFSGNNVIEVSVEGEGEYEYRLDFGPWQKSNTFVNVKGGERTIFVRDIYNCNLLEDIVIIIDYPKFLTPNGDGYNDTWNIYNIESQPNAKIYIFDRYGKLLKQISPNGTGWDGTYNQSPMPTSDYWFTIQYIEPQSTTVKQFKSHFSLKR